MNIKVWERNTFNRSKFPVNFCHGSIKKCYFNVILTTAIVTDAELFIVKWHVFCIELV